MKDLFLLDPTVTFLNHGSFGACPRPVFERYQAWQRELEAQPVEFLGRRILGLLDDARAELAAYVHADADDLAFVVNATAGVNIMARAVAATLQPGDEVLTTDHEYGACLLAWEWALQSTGARLVIAPLSTSLTSPAELVDRLFAHVTPRTRAVFFSHVTSNTALTLPAAAIVQRAREHGLIVLIDGAHAPAYLDLDLAALDADFYTGNLHKWLCAPKGAAFVHVRRNWQERTAPVYVSWGGYPGKSESFARRLSWQGTHDPAAVLTVPTAIAFQRDHDWPTVRERCRALAASAGAVLAGLLHTVPLTPVDPAWGGQMIAVPLPSGVDGIALKIRLYDDYRIEVPITVYHDRLLIRVSCAAYTTPADLERLYAALKGLVDVSG